METPESETMIKLFNEHYMSGTKRYPDKHFELAICDPPYFDGPNKLGFYGGRCSRVGVDRGGYKKLGLWKVPGPEYFKEVLRVSKNQIIWGVNYFPIENLGPGRIVWDKVNSTSTFSDCEIAYCSSIESVRIIRYMWNGMLQGLSIREGTTQQGNKQKNELRIHPTQKPVKLYEWSLQNYAKEGDKILDTHGGSMSLALACHNLGFDLTLYEIDKELFTAGKARLEEHQKQQRMFQ